MNEAGEARLTLVPRPRELQSPNESRIKTRSHLHPHTAEEQVDVHDSQSRLLVPPDRILICDLGNDWVRETQADLCISGSIKKRRHLE